jgi:hypothetical protein
MGFDEDKGGLMTRRVVLVVAALAILVVTPMPAQASPGRNSLRGGGQNQWPPAPSNPSCGDQIFNFGTGISSNPDGTDVRGEFTFTDRPLFAGGTCPGGGGVNTYKATCLSVVADRDGVGLDAQAAGVLIASSEPTPDQGPYLVIQAYDGNGVNPDVLSHFPSATPPVCSAFPVHPGDSSFIVLNGSLTITQGRLKV